MNSPDSTSITNTASELRAAAAMPLVGAGRSIFVPAIIISLTVVGVLALQTYQYAYERQVLAARLAGSQPQVQAAQRVRASLDALAVSTQKLAADGNPNARALVDELKRRGMTIDPSKAAQPPR